MKNMKVNYHTHCFYCDGKGDPELYVKEAIERGFSSLGFSSHAPLNEANDWTIQDGDLEKYFDRITELKIKYANVIKIYLGLEIDYYPNENRFEKFKKYNLDYSIGSVHMVKPQGYSNYFSVDASVIDFKKILEDVYSNNIENFGRDYYKALRDMIVQGGFNILGHLDLFKKFNRDNRFFKESDKWYKEEISECLNLLETRDIIVEVNTGAIARGVQDTPYPSQWIIEECYNRGIKICLNSDAHNHVNIDFYFSEALEIIKKSGYKELHTPFEILDLRGLV
ncbi:MAG: histidinol-phosphatase [Spirochaetales bacterium]|nr:histidinol-phosphatase [Spirochaetales bacterium]